MRYLVGLMIVAFAGSGLLLMALFTRELAQRITARRRLLRTEGVIVDAFRKQARVSPGQTRYRPAYRFLPVITFNPEGGPPVKFRSEVGDGGRESRYRVGQRVGVRYDPDGRTPPMLDTWAGLWLPPVMGIFAGLVFLAGSALAAWAVGARVVGR